MVLFVINSFVYIIYIFYGRFDLLLYKASFSNKKSIQEAFYPDTLQKERDYQYAIFSVVLSMITLPLGAYAGAAAAMALDAEKLKDKKSSKESFAWLFDGIFEAPGLATALLMLVVILEVIGLFILINFVLKSKDRRFIIHLYNSIAVGEFDFKFHENNLYIKNVRKNWPYLLRRETAVRDFIRILYVSLGRIKVRRDKIFPLFWLIVFSLGALLDGLIQFEVQLIGWDVYFACVFGYIMILITIYHITYSYEVYKARSRYKISQGFYKELLIILNSVEKILNPQEDSFKRIYRKYILAICSLGN